MSTARGALLVAVVITVAVAGGCAAPPAPAPPAAPPAAALATAPAPQPAPQPASQPTSRPAPVPPSAVAALRPSVPVGLDVPAIGVHTGALMRLGIDADGELEVPPDARTAGWFTLGPTPGARGPAVIAGHVDYAGVPGVFVRLRDLSPGQEVRVTRADGTRAVFTTYRVERYPKTGFPSADVYGDTSGPELRLITCGGSFDASSGQYRDNVVAFARLSGVAD